MPVQPGYKSKWPHQETVMVDDSMRAYIREIAAEDAVSISEVMRDLLDRGRAAREAERAATPRKRGKL